MKHLLISFMLIFNFTFILSAQGIVFDPGTPDTIYMQELVETITVPITVREIVEYRNYCVNDSFLVQTEYICTMIGCLVDHPKVFKWTHRTPTFDDFIDWLQKKYHFK